jgi:sialate O-acetylesterase
VALGQRLTVSGGETTLPRRRTELTGWLQEVRYMSMTRIALAVLIGLSVLAQPLRAEVKLNPLFADHMVLQQNKVLHLYGTAGANEKVAVSFQGKMASTRADKDGQWKVALGQFKAGGPFEMTVKGTNTIVLKDVLIGEVWICGGQSNMGVVVGGPYCQNSAQEVAAAKYPQLRLFTVDGNISLRPQRQLSRGEWRVCTPNSAAAFSAVGYFFGRDLHQALDVPVGMINNSYGGSPAEAWASPQAFTDPALAGFRSQWESTVNKTPRLFADYLLKLEAWKAQAHKDVASGGGPPPVPAMPMEFTNFMQPCVLYNAMMSPLNELAIGGVVWYQGEANCNDMAPALQYNVLLRALVQDWRTQRRDVDMPFLLVQLANCESPTAQPDDVPWARLREAQMKALKLPKTALAVAIDIGERDVHAKNKQAVGRRLCLAALGVQYGRKVVYSGPLYKSMKVESDKIRLTFTELHGGLAAKATNVKDAPLAGSELKRFAIAGADRKFVWANARIEGESVVVWSEQVANPVAVRYAWAINPLGCNLYNKGGLPASPFRTDDWPPGK